MLRILRLASFVFAFAQQTSAFADDEFAEPRRAMLDDIEALVTLTRAETGRAKLDPRVMAAMAKVPRHEFVPAGQRESAYKNRPLSIGEGQTISQPYIVALMTDLLDLESDDTVLEIGTGSGYQAAILAELVARVYTIEIVASLGREAAENLESYRHVFTRIGDGYKGWPEHGPFDAIIVTAVADHIPPALLDQLKPGARMVIPVGAPFMEQQLVVVEKNADGTISQTPILPVRFVPLTRDR